MATSVNTSLPLWLAGCTYDASGGNDLRNSGVTSLFFDEGIITGTSVGVWGGVVGGAGLAVTAGTGMTVLVGGGSFVVPNSGTPTAGGYVATLASQATLTVQTADPTNSRIDIVVANVVDAGNSSSFGEVQIITGVAAPSPTVPSAPANSTTLAQLTVPAGAIAITSGMIVDKRVYTSAAGGVLKAPVGSATGYPGQLAFDPATARFYHNSGTPTTTQLHVLPWAPVIAKTTSALTMTGSTEYTVLTATITTDGYTDIEIYFKWPGLSCSSGSTLFYDVIFKMYIDSNPVDSLFSPVASGDGYTQAGGVWSYYTSSATADTPSAGSHTVKVTAQLHKNLTVTAQIASFSTSTSVLRIEPVGM